MVHIHWYEWCCRHNTVTTNHFLSTFHIHWQCLYWPFHLRVVYCYCVLKWFVDLFSKLCWVVDHLGCLSTSIAYANLLLYPSQNWMETNAVVLKIDFCFVNEFRSSISSSINLIFIICLVRFAFVIGDWCFVCLCIFEGSKELYCGAVLCTKKASNVENKNYPYMQ